MFHALQGTPTPCRLLPRGGQDVLCAIHTVKQFYTTEHPKSATSMNTANSIHA